METAALFGMPKEMILAIITGACIAAALGLFIRSVLRGKSRPYIWAWLVRIALCVVAFISQLAGGATYSLALSGTQLVGCFVIVGCILYVRPRLGTLDRMDLSGIGMAAVGVAVWLASGNPLFGLLGALLADAAATAMGIRANIRKGTEESVPFWFCSLLAAIATLSTTGGAALVIVLTPLCSALNALVNIGTVILVRRRNRTQRLSATPEVA